MLVCSCSAPNSRITSGSARSAYSQRLGVGARLVEIAGRVLQVLQLARWLLRAGRRHERQHQQAGENQAQAVRESDADA